MATTSAFYTDSNVSLEKRVDSIARVLTEESRLGEVYEVDRCAAWITEHGYTRVGLQFPDELMPDAIGVITKLQQLVPTTVTLFILGDTSYGSCCVDEVAAQHNNADSLIHFGRSCLSQPSTMPVLFVFGRLPLDIQHCVEQFHQLFPDPDSHVIVLYDTAYTYSCDSVSSALAETYPNVVMSRLASQTNTVTEEESSAINTTHTLCGRCIVVPSDKTLTDYAVFYIGEEGLTLTNLVYNFRSKTFCTYNPISRIGCQESFNVNRMLMKRFYLIEKAKDANIVGILIGTLGVSKYRHILERLKQLIKKAGKKTYVFIVGKINVAKLANFMEIDLFVLIACSENTLLDSSEFYKPVVTPYEMEVACNTDREWTGDYPTDFSQLLEGGCHYVPIPDQIDQSVTDVSLVTGRLRQLGQGDPSVETGTALVLKEGALMVSGQAGSAREFLEQRVWKGLEQNLGGTPVTKAVEGQRGIAMGYTTGNDDDQH